MPSLLARAGLPLVEPTPAHTQSGLQGLVVEALNDRAADLGLGLGLGDRGPEPQQGRLPEREVALPLGRARDRRGSQLATLRVVVDRGRPG